MLGRSLQSSITVLLVVFALLCIDLTSGSLGDWHPHYRECTSRCRKEHGCPQRLNEPGWGGQPCFRCKYDCVWATDAIIRVTQPGKSPAKFHGEWPLAAIQLGGIVIQEPTSAIFSFLNFVTTYLFWQQLDWRSNIQEKQIWRGYGVVGMIAWFWSTIFHCVDCWVTEWMDYFAACGYCFAGLCVAVLYTLPVLTKGKYAPFWRFGLPTSVFLIWLNHVIGMMHNFDYGYNMKVCLFVSFLSAILYGCFLFNRRRRNKRFSLGDRWLISTLLLLMGNALFVLHDFEPLWWTIDGHALFHLVTIPVPLMLHSALRHYSNEKMVLLIV